MRRGFLGGLPHIAAAALGCTLVLASAVGVRDIPIGEPGFDGVEASLAAAGIALIFVGLAPPIWRRLLRRRRAPGRVAAGAPAPASGAPLALWLTGTALLLLALLALRAAGVPVDNMLRDAVSVANLTPEVGALTTLGVILWAMTVGVCLSGALLLRRVPDGSEDARFLLATGGLAALAMVDDAFLVHEQLTSERQLGLSQAWVLGTYAVLGLLWAIRFRHELRQSHRALLSAVLLGFGASTFMDQFEYDTILEDAPKLSAIVALLLFSLSEVRRRLTPSGGPIVRA